MLSDFLNSLASKYHGKHYLDSDPLEFAHRYSDPWDQEAIALAAAVLAYGNVKQIRRSVEDLIQRIDSVASGPAAFTRSFLKGESAKKSAQALQGFVHRFNRGEDLEVLFRLLAKSWKEYGSLGGHFVSHLKPNDPDISQALSHLMVDWKSWVSKLPGPKPLESFAYLLTSPEDGSCCKRWCMFLRWMVRKDELDLGLWSAGGALAGSFPEGQHVRPDQLVIPLDTHTGRISQYLGLTQRKSLNWLAALEVTQSLKACDPDDPTRYDFSISRLGILDLCQRKYRAEICSKCELEPVCQFAKSHRQKPKGRAAS